MPQAADVLVVGGGPAGLATAIALVRRGLEPLVLEAADAPGGRVRTDLVGGHQLDRGFAVVNTAYPALARFAPPGRLGLRLLPSAVSVWWDGGLHAFGNPFASPAVALATARAPFARPGDLVALARIGARLLRSNRAAIGSDADDAAAAGWLLASGISETFVDAFFRPFFGGVLLDPDLTTSARVLRYDLRQFIVGRAALPARGMRAVPELMEASLGAQRIRTGARVGGLLRDDRGGVVGVRLEDGSELLAGATVVATDAPSAAALTGVALHAEGSGEVCVHVAVDRPLLPGGRLLLDPDPLSPFMNAVEPSAVQPAYAPAGSALLMLVAPGMPGSAVAAGPRAGWDDATWAAAAGDRLRTWFPALPAGATRVVRVDRIRFGVLRQPPGIHARLRAVAGRSSPGLVLAGEHTLAAGLNAAMLSGERAARTAAAEVGARAGRRRS